MNYDRKLEYVYCFFFNPLLKNLEEFICDKSINIAENTFKIIEELK